MAESLPLPGVPKLTADIVTLYDQPAPAAAVSSAYGRLYKKATPDDSIYWKVGATEYKLSTGAGGVSSGQGTADQVLVNGTSGSQEVGDLIFTLPQSVGTASNVQFNALGLGGVASDPTYALWTGSRIKFTCDFFGAMSDAITQMISVSGNVGYFPDGGDPLYSCYAMRYDTNINNVSIVPPGIAVINEVGVISITSNFATPAGVTTTAAAGLRVQALTASGAGVIADCYGGYFTAQTVGATTNTALYADNLLVGDDAKGRNAPARGMVVSGSTVIGVNALLTTATSGFLHIPVCAGVPTGVPTAIGTNVPLVYDTVDHKLYIYDGGWKSATFA